MEASVEALQARLATAHDAEFCAFPPNRNLSAETTWQQLRAHFSETAVHLAPTHAAVNQGKGTGTMRFATANAAAAAARMHGSTLLGHVLAVEVGTNRGPDTPVAPTPAAVAAAAADLERARIRQMTVPVLKAELQRRGLPTKGLKAALQSQLLEACGSGAAEHGVPTAAAETARTAEQAAPAEPAALGAAVAALVGGDAQLWELAAIFSAPGAAPQVVHADAVWSPAPLLLTAFVALQPVTQHGQTPPFTQRLCLLRVPLVALGAQPLPRVRGQAAPKATDSTAVGQVTRVPWVPSYLPPALAPGDTCHGPDPLPASDPC